MKNFILTPTKIEQTEGFNKEKITKKFKVHSRDLRPVFNPRQASTVLRRGGVLIMNFSSIKCVMNSKQAVIYCGEKILEEVQDFFSERIKKQKEFTTLFEFFVLDKLVFFAVSKLKKEFDNLSRQSSQITTRLNKTPSNEDLESLLRIKKRIGKFRTNLESFDKTLSEFLVDEESVSDVILQKQILAEQIEEAESIIENLSQQVQQLDAEVEDLDDEVDDMQDILSLKISSKRNTIVQADLVISFITMVLGVGGVVVGLYGMNIRNNVETDHGWFLIIGFGLLGFFFLSFFLMFVYFRKKKIF